MARLHGTNILRPARIGFVVRPSDGESVSRIMRWCACVWGGQFNPIIPVGIYPKIWREKNPQFRKPHREIAREYMKFFEPDVLVEAEPGLAESIGYGALSGGRLDNQLTQLENFYSDNGNSNPGFQFGLSVTNTYREIYKTEYQFELRDPRPAYVFRENSLSTIVEAMFGAFPIDEKAACFRDNYESVFKPEFVNASSDHWLNYFFNGAITPFIPTRYKLEVEQRGSNDLSFYIFDHSKTADLIDLWNKRLFERPVYPIPLCWIKSIAPKMVELINVNFRPIPNNRSGMTYHSIIYFGRSIKKDVVDHIANEYLIDCPNDSFRFGGVWHPEVTRKSYGPICERHAVKSRSVPIDAEVTDENLVEIDTIAPDFASRFGGNNFRWANVLNFRAFREEDWALLYPSNLEDRTKPRILQNRHIRPVITREGWVFGQIYQGIQEWINLADGTTAIAEWLEGKGITATPSSAGKIAKQVISSLGGLWDTHLISHKRIIELLDSMAMQETTRENDINRKNRHYEGRTANIGEWNTLIKEINKNSLREVSLDELTKRNILRLGLGVECPNCNFNNWYGLDGLGYKVICERCLKGFSFPQGRAKREWKYRVTGPFSVPNYAEGAYSVALTLNTLQSKIRGPGDTNITFSTGLDLTHKRFKKEIDFALWYSEGTFFRQRREPVFVFGEAKSFANDSVNEADIETLKLVTEIVPNSIVVVAVMKDKFSDSEKSLLTGFLQWCWETKTGLHRGQLLLLTGVELFSEFSVESEWEKLGEPYSTQGASWVFGELDEFALATQRIHLGLDFYQKFHR